MSKSRRIAKNSSILYLNLLITSVIGIVFSRLILDVLGASDYGLYNVVAGFVAVLNMSNLFLIGTTYRFISYELGKEDIQGVNRVFNISLMLHVAIALGVLLLAETIGMYYILNYLNVESGRLADAIFVFRLSVIAAVFSIVSVPYQGLMTAYEEFGYKSVIDVLQVVVKLIFAAALIGYAGNRLRVYAVLMLMLMVGCFVLYFLHCQRKHSAGVKWNPVFEMEKYREMLGFAGWSSIGSLVCMGRVQGNALIINYFFGTILNASFGIANQVNQVLLMFSQSVGQAVVPQIIQSYSSGDHDRATRLVCYVNKYSFLMMLLPALPLLLEMDYLLKIWLVKVPDYTSIFCRLMVINALLDCLASSGIPAYVQATGNIKVYQLINGTTQLLVLPIACGLLMFGLPPYIIFWAQILITMLVIPIRLILLKILYNFDVKALFQISAVRGLLVSLMVLPLFILRPFLGEGFMQFSAVVLAALVYSGVMIYGVGLEAKEKDKIKSLLWDYLAKGSNAERQ